MNLQRCSVFIILLAVPLQFFFCSSSPTSANNVSVPVLASAVVGDGSVTLNWNLDTDAIAYNLYYVAGSTVDRSTGILIRNVLPGYLLANLKNGTEYAFAISALNPPYESGLSNVKTAVPQSFLLEIGMKSIPGGTFTMGSNDSIDDYGAFPPHSVTVSSFHMDSTDVTQQEYQEVMTGMYPSYFSGDLNRPVESITWYDAVLYCNARSKQDKFDTVYSFSGILSTGEGCNGLTNLSYDLSRSGYRLPTEAQWEYACRAGTTTPYYWGDTIDGSYCWDYDNCGGTTHPVALKKPNAFGLYDMSGNVWEWCNDFYASYTATAQTDPTGPSSTSEGTRVLRGGSGVLNNDDTYLRSAYRSSDDPAAVNSIYGIRCVRP